MRWSVAIKERVMAARRAKKSSLDELCLQFPQVPRTTLAYWVRLAPLEKQELRARAGANAKKSAAKHRKFKKEDRVFALELRRSGGGQYTRAEKGRIAEAAVLLRLAILGVPIYGSPFDGDAHDWVVRAGDRFVTIQVKWASSSKGSPSISLCRADGRKRVRKYTMADGVDFFVGYDLLSDTACIWAQHEVVGRPSVRFDEQAAEAWSKLLA
jgi:transposase-like protein